MKLEERQGPAMEVQPAGYWHLVLEQDLDKVECLDPRPNSGQV